MWRFTGLECSLTYASCFAAMDPYPRSADGSVHFRLLAEIDLAQSKGVQTTLCPPHAYEPRAGGVSHRSKGVGGKVSADALEVLAPSVQKKSPGLLNLVWAARRRAIPPPPPCHVFPRAWWRCTARPWSVQRLTLVVAVMLAGALHLPRVTQFPAVF